MVDSSLTRDSNWTANSSHIMNEAMDHSAAQQTSGVEREINATGIYDL